MSPPDQSTPSLESNPITHDNDQSQTRVESFHDQGAHFIVSTKFHYFKIVPPVSPYIIMPPGGIIIYELA